MKYKNKLGKLLKNFKVNLLNQRVLNIEKIKEIKEKLKLKKKKLFKKKKVK